VLSRFLTMTRTAKRAISNAAAMAACAVCLVVAAAIVMVPVLALAHRQPDQPPPFHALVDRVSSDGAWDADRVSDVALADVFSRRSPARTGQLADIGQAGRLDAGFLLGVHVPADARRDARAAFAADAARDSLVAVRSRPGQAEVVVGHSVAGPDHRMATPWMRVAHGDGHAAANPAVGAEWHGSVTFMRLVRSVDACGQRLPVESAVRNQVHPTSLSAHGKFRALDAGHLRDRAAQLRAAARASEPDSACGPSPKWTPEVSDHIHFHFRGLFTYCVSARFPRASQRLYSDHILCS
jgi:hypothetical protein